MPQLGLGREKHLRTLPGGPDFKPLSVAPSFVTCFSAGFLNKIAVGPTCGENFLQSLSVAGGIFPHQWLRKSMTRLPKVGDSSTVTDP